MDYREQPLEPARLAQWARALGGWPRLVNRASMTWRRLPEDRKDPGSDREWLALIRAHPALVRRPVVWDGSEVSVGFREAAWAQRFT